MEKPVEVKCEENNEKRDSNKHQNSNSSPNRSLYKQLYRKVWEQLPEFKGWLQPDPKNKERAFCRICDRYFHAHRLSLLKHTTSIKHMRLAKLEYETKSVLKQRLLASNTQVKKSADEKIKTAVSEKNRNPKVDSSSTNDSQNKSATESNGTDPDAILSDDIIHPECVYDCQDDDLVIDSTPTPPTPAPIVKPPITTHVLDTAKGVPVPGLPVVLYKLVNGRWTYIKEAFTNPDGRCSDLINREELEPGRFKLHFDTDKYYEVRKNDRLYPFIEIVFDLHSPSEHVHIPLLMTPFGYTTYKGS